MLTSNSRAAESVRVLLLVALCLALFFYRLDARSLWEIDEGMHAATAAEMVRTGDWLTPRFNGEPFFDKPVFFNWLTAVSLKLLGFTELAVRLPAALLGLGTVLATYLLGRRMFGSPTAFLGAAVLASSVMFVVLSRVVVHDMCLTFFLTVALGLFYAALFDPSAQEGRRRKVYLALAWTAMGCAILTKGPIGVVLSTGIALVFLLWIREARLILKSQLVSGIVILLVVAGPWYLAMHLEHPDFIRYFIVEQHLGNIGGDAVNGTPRHEEPFYFYVPILLGGLFPWTFFLPAALFTQRPNRKTPEGRATTFLWIWAGLTLLIFTVSTSKLPTYVLPVFPPLALLLGAAWVKLMGDPARGVRRLFVGGAALLSAVGVGALVFALIAPPVELNVKYGVDLGHITAICAVLAVGFGLALVLMLRRRYGPAQAAVALTLTAMFVATSVLVLPRVDPYRSTKEIVLRLDRELPPGEDFMYLAGIVGVADSALFYTDRKAVVMIGYDTLEQFLASEERVYCFAKRGPLKAWSTPKCESFIVGEAGKRVVFSNREGALPPVP